MSPWSKGGAYMGLAFILPVSMFVAHWVGERIHPRWGGTIGLIFGFAAGLYETYRQAMIIERRK